MVLTELVSNAHLAGLRRDGVSYIFAGGEELDLGLALEILNRELGLERRWSCLSPSLAAYGLLQDAPPRSGQPNTMS